MRLELVDIHPVPACQAMRGLVIGIGIVISSSIGLTQDQDWPVFRGDPSSQGASSSNMPGSPEKIWEFQVPNGAFESTPVIADGRVFLGDMDGELYAIDLQSGKQIWKVETESGFIASAAVQDGVVVFGDFDGNILALSADEGKQRWSFKTEAQIDSGANFHQGNALIASEDGSLYCLDLQTGTLKWKYETGDQLRCSATIVGNQTFLGGCDSILHAVDLTLGKSIGEPMQLGGPTGSTPSVHEALVVVPTHSGSIIGFDWKRSIKLWEFADQELSSEVKSSPAIALGKAFITTRNRRLLAIELESGKLAWQATLRKRSDSSPVYCDGRVWVGATDGRLYAFDAQTGNQVWVTEVPGGLMGSPAIANNRLVIASEKGSVFCFGMKGQ